VGDGAAGEGADAREVGDGAAGEGDAGVVGGATGGEAGEAVRPESPRPILRWSTARATGPGWRSLALRPAETYLFDLAHQLPSPRLDVRGRARVLVVNLMGDVLSDVTAEGAVDLPDRAAAVIIERAGEPDRPIGWDLTTLLRPVTPWTYLADGAVVQLRRPAALGPTGTDADGVAAHALVRDRESCTTRLAAQPGWTVVVACDALSIDADPADIEVVVAGGALTGAGTTGGADAGRRHLVFSVVEQTGPTLDLTVTTGEGWSCAGVVAGRAGPEGADVWLAAFAESPWRSLFDPPAAPGPQPRRAAASGAATVRFSPASAPEATDG
jgi:hypothetical protein